MKRLGMLFLLLLLTACGSGGGGSPAPSRSSSEPTGILSINIDGGDAAKTVALPAEPGWVRIVVRNLSDPRVKQIQDVQIGGNPANMLLKAGSGYTVEVVSYAKNGTLRNLVGYGAAVENGNPTGITIGSDMTATVTIGLSPIAAPTLNVASNEPGGLFRPGGTFSVTAAIPAESSASLQPAWSLASQTSAFIVSPHLATPPLADSPSGARSSLPIPVAGKLVVQGEFFINPNLILGKSESATSWIFNSAPVEKSIDGTVIGGLEEVLSDSYSPHVTSFGVSQKEQPQKTFTGFTVSATDNVTVTGYKLTTSATPPVNAADSLADGAAGSNGWVATSGALSYSDAGLVSGQKVTLYVWARDARGNVSQEVKSVDVTYNNSPAITGVSLPEGVLRSPAINLSITARTYNGPGGVGRPSRYCIYAAPKSALEVSATPPAEAICSDWTALVPAGKAVSTQAVALVHTAPVSDKVESFPLHIWVEEEGVGFSKGVSGRYSIGKLPQMSAATATAVRGTTTVNVRPVSPATAITFSAYEGSRITGYLINESLVKPALDDANWTAIPAAATYSQAGYSYTLQTAPASLPATRDIFIWMKDDAGRLGVTSFWVRFMQ